MNEIFGASYAKTYDLVYGDKDYNAECDAIERLIGEFGDSGVRRVLDLGCGTGRHAIPLCERGYEVTGLDRSAAMLTRARESAEKKKLPQPIAFHQADIQTMSIEPRCDVALIMFNVLGYIVGNDELLAALRRIRRRVRPGGLLIGDIWYGPSVIANPPGERTKQIDQLSGKIVRQSSGTYNTVEQTCEIAIKTLRFEENRQVEETRETHKARYFFPLELDLALRCANFRLLAMREFPNVDELPSLGRWPAAFIARTDEIALPQ